MITDADIAQAETRVTEIRERSDRLRMANRDETADAIRLEIGRLTELKAAKEQQDAALKARKAAEKPYAAELKSMNAELSDSAKAVDKARQEAAQALEKLIAALRDHNTAVSSVHARLAALGLPLGDKYATYDTGHGSAGTLCINGVFWSPVPADTMAQHAVTKVMKQEFGEKHPAARMWDARIHSLVRGVGGLKVA
ncbi:hypothetical protein ACFW1F_07580 [Streptomyces bungoensis]|uniref:hypothetical protein n=1 Tax=Streptomyces bungoensis TaxID=285568 RepID=UPI0036A9493C